MIAYETYGSIMLGLSRINRVFSAYGWIAFGD